MISYMREHAESISKQEFAYQVIRDRILQGIYVPGFRLVIDSLAREFGTSIIPVREAIRRLEAEGLVEYQRNAGARVAPIDPRAFAEILSVLALLEGYATALAAPRLERSDIDRLRELNGHMREAIQGGAPLRFSELNREFHFTIYARCPNAYLVENIRQAWARLDSVRRTVFLYIPTRGLQSTAEHEEIVQAIEMGAPAERLMELARQHKLATVQAFQEWESWKGHL
jgi:DNA-binding GntR family transcriptional regulator